MANLFLSLLGSYQVRVDKDLFDEYRTNKVRALLAYLAVESAFQDREALMDLLWPGMPERSARVNLRQIIYFLRKAFPDVNATDGTVTLVPILVANRHAIQLNPTATIEVDVVEFESLLERTQLHQHPDLATCKACNQLLEQAIDLYQGDFLADFWLDDSDVFEEWAQSRRKYYQRKVLDALEMLTVFAIGRQDYPQAERYAESQLEIDNLRESAHRQLMEVLARSGRRSEALAAYDTCRTLLGRELGMAPSVRTTELYEKIRSGDLTFGTEAFRGIRGFDLKNEIGRGAQGTIYLATQKTIGREVVVKAIRREYADDPDFIRRFEAEAQVVAQLEHPYIVPLHDYWRDPDGAYLVMRFMRGGSLLTALEAGAWDTERAVNLMDQVSAALATAHRQGVVHRDIKPANILLDEEGNAFLSDFGIAKEIRKENQFTA